MADVNKFSFAKLDNSNWQCWKFRMEMLLTREELWYVVSEEKPEVPTAAWKKDDQKARATIGLCIEESQYSMVKSASSAKDYWDQLRSYHEKTTVTSRVSLLKKLCSLNLSEGGDLEHHLIEIESLFDRLTAAGQELQDSLRIAMILRSLPDSYGGLVTALESRADADLTMQLVKSKLLDEFERRKERCGDTGSGAKAMKSAAKRWAKPSGSKRDSEKDPGCYYCKKPGHFQRNCRLLAQQQSEDKKKKPDVKPKAKQAKDERGGVCFLAVAGVARGGTGDYSDSWYIDSGASCHMTNDKSFFSTISMKVGPNVVLADGKVVETAGCGEGTVRGIDGEGNVIDVKLEKVLFVPSLTSGLISVDRLTSNGFTAVFRANGCDVRDATGKVVVVGERSGCLYRLKQAETSNQVQGKAHDFHCQHQWHRRFGHRDPSVISRISNEHLGVGMNVKDCGIRMTCEPCLEGKLSRNPIPKAAERKSTKVLDLVHTDLCGPMKTTTPGGKRFLMTMIDDHSRFTVVYLLERKSDAVQKIKEYVRYVENLFDRKPRVIRSDGGGEYVNNELRTFFADEGIKAQYTTAYTPQQNGVAERKNRSLQEMATTMLLDAGLDKRYWGEAVLTAAYLQNRLPSRSVDTTPYHKWYGRKPELGHLRVYGCPAYVHIPDVKRGKFERKARKLRFIGYSDQHKGYRFVDTETDKVTISRDARFLELEDGSLQAEKPLQEKPSTGGEDEWCFVPKQSLEEEEEEPEDSSEEESEDESEEESEQESVDNSDRDDSESEDYFDVMNSESGEDPLAVKEEEQDEALSEPGGVRRSVRRNRGTLPGRLSDFVVGIATHSGDEPTSYAEAVASSERDLWKAAMDSEIQSHQRNGTWELVQLPEGKKVVGSKWVFKVKRNEADEVIRHKARIVAQGFTQRYGVDYEEVFSPVTKHATLRVLLTLAGQQKLVLKHLDVRTAYLYGDIDEDIFMRQPPGYEERGKEELVCKLRRSIYGLKQSARCWNIKLSSVLAGLGFEASSADPCLYTATRNGEKIYLVVYVDDFLVGCHSEEEIAGLFEELSQHFEIVCLGDVKYFLGLEVGKDNGVYSLSLRNYIDKLIAKLGLKEAKVAKTPMDQGYVKDATESEPFEDGTLFRSVVGALMYIAVCARPDIMTSAAILGRKFSSPTAVDWTTAKRVVRYLKLTKDWKLRLGGESNNELIAYSDSDWAGDKSTRKSTTGIVVYYAGGAVSWASRRQDCVTLSTMEAEYVALAETCQEVIWLRRLLEDFGLKQKKATIVNEDNQGCLSFAKSARSTKRSKHIETKHHFVKDLCDRAEIKLQYCPTAQMNADILTKPLGLVKHYQFADRLGMVGEKREANH